MLCCHHLCLACTPQLHALLAMRIDCFVRARHCSLASLPDLALFMGRGCPCCGVALTPRLFNQLDLPRRGGEARACLWEQGCAAPQCHKLAARTRRLWQVRARCLAHAMTCRWGLTTDPASPVTGLDCPEPGRGLLEPAHAACVAQRSSRPCSGSHFCLSLRPPPLWFAPSACAGRGTCWQQCGPGVQSLRPNLWQPAERSGAAGHCDRLLTAAGDAGCPPRAVMRAALIPARCPPLPSSRQPRTMSRQGAGTRVGAQALALRKRGGAQPAGVASWGPCSSQTWLALCTTCGGRDGGQAGSCCGAGQAGQNGGCTLNGRPPARRAPAGAGSVLPPVHHGPGPHRAHMGSLHLRLQPLPLLL